MKFSLHWLQRHLEGSVSAEQASSTLTLIGHEVESVDTIGSDLDGVVLGRVLSVRKHPDADRLRCCVVDVSGVHLPIVCGAPNVAEGQIVAVATVGTILPILDKEGNPLVIREAKIRGEVSRGMICAEDELGLGEDHSGIMVLNGKVAKEETGTPLKEALNLSSDSVIDVSLTPNRPDASSHRGLARDLAAALGMTFKEEAYTLPPGEVVTAGGSGLSSTPAKGSDPPKSSKSAGSGEKLPELEDVSIQILAGIECPRYVARRISGVRVGPSPDWLQQILRSIGLRPVNNVVDCTNYVLFDIGQPLHAFDAKTITSGILTVRTFSDEVRFTTLDHVERRIPGGSLFICNGDTPVALAGIMGGENSEITKETTEVLLESAYFDSGLIRKTSKLTGLQTDASYRYERGMDPQICRSAADVAAKMIADVCGGTVIEACTDVISAPHKGRTIAFRPSRCEKILGRAFEAKDIESRLSALGIRVEKSSKGEWTCHPPSFRPDLEREIDLVEEIGRLSDYNALPRPQMQPAFTPEVIPAYILFKERVRKIAVNLRYKEILTNSLVSEEESKRFSSDGEAIETLNPVSSDATTLRTTLMGGMLTTMEFNIRHKSENLRFFEIGHTYRWSESTSWITGILEEDSLVLGIHGRPIAAEWSPSAGSGGTSEFTEVKADLLSLLQILGLSKGLSEEFRTHKTMGCDELVVRHSGKEIASLVTISADLAKKYDLTRPATLVEIPLNTIYGLLERKEEQKFQPIAKYPSLEFDLAFVVTREVPAYKLVDEIRECGGALLVSIELFDIFEGESIGKENKSLAFRLTFQDSNKTLNINIIEPIIKKIIHILNRKVQATLRS